MLPIINNIPQTRLFTEEFRGLHAGERAADGEFSDILNFTSDDYPVLSTRKKRKKAFPVGSAAFPVYAAKYNDEAGVVMVREDLVDPSDPTGEHKPMLFINAHEIGRGIDIGLDDSITRRRSIVRMGAYIIIVPDGVYYNVSDASDYGRIDISNTARSTSYFTAEQIDKYATYNIGYMQSIATGKTMRKETILGKGESFPAQAQELDFFYLKQLDEDYKLFRYSNGSWRPMEYTLYSICDSEGQDLTPDGVGKTKPASPADGYSFFSIVDGSLEKFNSDAGMWMPENYLIRLEAPNAGAGFKAGDYIDIETYGTGGLTPSPNCTSMINSGLHEVKLCGDDYIVFQGKLTRPVIIQYEYADLIDRSIYVELSRRMPEMDYVTECNNRLWGCKYGEVNGKIVNEIYCCKLGDFCNWNAYSGISTDAWSASVGVPGEFTGAVTYGDNPIFFKKNAMLSVYVSSTGAHQLSSVSLDGVKSGAAESLAVINGLLYYRGNRAFYAYDGSYPVIVSDTLDKDVKFRTVKAATAGDKYYAACETADEPHKWYIYVYDTARGIWMKERICENYSAPIDTSDVSDTSGVVEMFSNTERTEIYIINSVYALICVNGGEIPLTGTFIGSDNESTITFEALLPVWGYSYPDNKYISRLDLRIKMSGATVNVWIQYDNNETWHSAGSFSVQAEKKDTFILPVIPRRCDTLQLKITGSGSIKLYSIARILETGSDVR